MSESVVLPALGESVTEGTVTRWLKQVGDTVEVDEPLLEVSTDKVDTEVPSPVAGVIEEILVQEDETAEVGAVLARIGDGSGAQSSSAPEASAPAESAAPAPEDQKPAEAAPAAPTAPATSAPATSAPATSAPAAATSGDSQDVLLPSLGESITEGTVTRWLKQVGESVEVDEPLLEVSTDKVDTEVPSPIAGVLQEVLVGEDETVEVGGVLARIGSGVTQQTEASEPPTQETPAPAEQAPPAADAAEPAPVEQAPAPAAAPEPAKPASAPAPAAAATASDSAQSDSSASGYVTPIVRKLANERGVDLSTITGTGVGGRIRKEDVIAAATATTSTAAEPAATAAKPVERVVSELRGTTQKMSRLRKIVAERAVASLQTTAQLTTTVKVDVTRVAQLRQAKKDAFLEKTGSKLSFLPFFAIAAVEALQAYPVINSTVEDDSIVYPDVENLSIAVDTERGLLTPVLRDAGSKNIAQISTEIAELADRTRNNKLTPDELSGGTFTLTNTGSRGALFDTPLVFLPQSAILGTGAVVKEPGVVSTPDGDSIGVRSYVYLALSYDHRTIDGADAARFLTQMKSRLEEGNFEADLGI
ncbi:2-oxoglutarate dehydrogenase, E2 component, dihydrolipoamide succinyltransferase [Leucobacter denitrificans]|uniref:Dihydrolipoamide acetyltransferase component of pyruvate dehydrogenase complex n=1 Tax=Leucobacter denitrificans TaxID=683042 RepID=A0A7G9S5M9_9MICO|nr:2-oxoglutarate dehydrogenase, E2 component, dihydrolipoamide succinyltransferase [Leucobacter denitrificans]QNN63154.1 2-oxoglutarate dehydrogenase, E2 component, dihydrolipoamide succinyltransferase [Leucobacter denitrificans]